MKITPLDISRQEFRRVMRGYDVDEVDSFLDTVSNEYEELTKENSRLRERIKTLEDKVGEYREMEKAMENALISVERVSEEIKLNAQKEAELMIREAELKARDILREGDALSKKLREDIVELKRQRQILRSKLKATIETHLKMIEFEDEEDQESPDTEGSSKT
jgi:cell division initiation protein